MDLERLRLMEHNLRAMARSLKATLDNTEPEEDPNKKLFEVSLELIEQSFEELKDDSKSELERLSNMHIFLDVAVHILDPDPRTDLIAGVIRIAMSSEERFEF